MNLKRKLMLGLSTVLISSLTFAALPVLAETSSVTEAPAIQVVQGEKGLSISNFAWGGNFEDLVEQGLITAEQAAAMKDFMEQERTEMQAEMEKIFAMTEEEQKAHLEDKTNFVPREDPYTQMIAAGIINQSEADAIQAYQQARAQEEMQAHLEKQMQQYVQEGILPAETADAAVTYLMNERQIKMAETKAAAPDVHVFRAEGSSMNEREFKIAEPKIADTGVFIFRAEGSSNLIEAGEATEDADMEKFPAQRTIRVVRSAPIWQELVDAGIITEEQKTAMEAWDQTQIEQEISEQGGKVQLEGMRFKTSIQGIKGLQATQATEASA